MKSCRDGCRSTRLLCSSALISSLVLMEPLALSAKAHAQSCPANTCTGNATIEAGSADYFGERTWNFQDNVVVNLTARDALTYTPNPVGVYPNYTYFRGNSTLNVNAEGAISGGLQNIQSAGVTVNVNATRGVVGGQITMLGGTLNINAANGMENSWLTLGGNSVTNMYAVNSYTGSGLGISGGTLNARVAGAMGGSLYFQGGGTLNILADNALIETATVRFSDSFGTSGGNMFLNGNDLRIAAISYVTPNYSATIANNGNADSTLTLLADYNPNPQDPWVYGGDIRDSTNGATGVLNLVKSGSHTLLLSGSNTYSGSTTVNAGTLRAGRNGAFTANTAYSVNGGTLDLNNHALTMSSLSGTGGAITLGSAALAINQAATTSYAGSISGAGGLTKSGAGTLTLTGANTYGGRTAVNAGTLRAGAAGGLTANAAYIVNGGTLDLNNHALTMSSLSGTGGAIALGSAALAINQAATTFYAGSISGTGGLTKSGAGTLMLTGANSYSGGTTVNAGMLLAGSVGAFAANTAYSVNGGTLDLNNHALTMSSLSGTGGAITLGSAALAINQAASTTYAGSISGTGGLTKSGAGTLRLTGTNSYSGDTTVVGGALQFGDGVSNGASRLAGDVSVIGGGLGIMTLPTFTVAGDVTFANNTALSIAASASGPSFQAASLALGNNVTFNISGINHSSQLDHILINTTSGISGDFGAVSVGGFTGVVDYLTVNTRKTDDNKQYIASYGLGWTAGNNLAHGTFTLANATDRFQVGAALGDQAANAATGWNGTALTKAGAGTLILTGANSYSGGTTISGGTLQIGNGGTTGSISGDVINNGALTFSHINTQTFAGLVSGSGSVSQIGSGTLILTGNNSYSGGTTVSGGMLQVGNGGTTGSISGDVKNNGALTFNRSDTLAFAGDISGSGFVSQIGSGTLILTGNNSYLGGTNIQAGTLEVSADSNLGANASTLFFTGGALSTSASFDSSRAVTLVETGIFNTTAGTELGLSGAVLGGADLMKSGAGTLRLDNAGNDYGNTLVQAGTLIGRVGSISGRIGNAGTVVFDQAVDASFGGDILDLNGTSGAMIKRGVGNLTLAGVSTLDWSIEAGGLVASAERFGGNANISTNATLIFNQQNNASYGGVLAGTGRFIKTGAGSLIHDGNSAAFAGVTDVAAGALIVGSDTSRHDAVLGGSVNVEGDATLRGHGTVGSGVGSRVTVTSGGTLSAGNSIGTLTINGDLTLETGSHFAVEVDPTGSASDLVRVTGNTTLNGGSVAHIGVGGDYKLRSTYTILAADGALSGRFDTVTSDFAFLRPDLGYDYGAGTVALNLTRNDVNFATLAATRNQAATASGIDSIGIDAGHAVYDAIALLPDNSDVIRASFDQLSGEIHGSAKTAFLEDSHFVRDAANDRIRAAFGDVAAAGTPVMSYGEGGPTLMPATTDRIALWGQGFGGWGHNASDGNASRLGTSTGGFLMGGDAEIFDNWRLGVLAGYSQTRFDSKDRSSSGSSDNYHLGLYGGTSRNVGGGNLGFRSGLAYTWHDVDTSRSVTLPGFSDQLKGGYDAGSFQAFGELGYRIDTAMAAFEPFANLAHVSLNTGSFQETGGAAALSAGSQSTDTTFSTLGLRASTSFNLGGVSATARGTLGWRHAFGDTVPVSTQSFAGSDSFTIAGVPIAKDSAIIETGLDVKLSPLATLGLFYQGQIANEAQQHGVKVNFGIRF